MPTRPDVIARAVFDYLNDPNGHEPYGPYSFNEDRRDLTVEVDGRVHCVSLADAIEKAIYESEQIPGWTRSVMHTPNHR